MRTFKNIKELQNVKTSKHQSVVFSSKRLKIFGSLFCILLTLGMFGFSLSNLGFSDEVRRITSSWAPNLQDIGKLKFVSKEDFKTESEALTYVSEMAMPFSNCYVSLDENEGAFVVNGLGSLVVKSCMDGRVSKIQSSENKKTITLSHGRGLTSVYECIDNVCVQEGDSVKKNMPIGISLSSCIMLKVKLGGKLLAGLTVKDGEMTFS